MSQPWPMLHQTIVMVDVAGFTRSDRTPLHQNAVIAGLRNILPVAFAEAGLDWTACTVEDRGDGKMILVPPEVPKSRLADQLPSRLVAGLRRHNAVHAIEATIQLRVALHAGEAYQDEQGVVSPAVNVAARLVDAPQAKSALRSSRGVLALIVSDVFYRDVIVHDPASDPGLYREISVLVSENPVPAWLRLADQAAPVDGEGRQAALGRVLELLPEKQLQRLREWLMELALPELRTLLHRAAGPGVPPAPNVANAWDAFVHLAEFNAGANGFPPALKFVELLAGQVGIGSGMSANLRTWNDDQARRLRLDPQLKAWRAAGVAPVPLDSRLHLMIVVEPDGIDPHRYGLSYWRQDDPAQWPPARGETHLVTVEELERCVDDVVVSAERAWSGHAGSVALEFVLPRALLNLPVHLWCKEHDSPDPRPLCLDYPVVLRSLERMRSPHWHRVWHQRWQTLMNDPSPTRVYFGQPADTEARHRIAAVLADPRWVLMVLAAAPPGQPPPGPDELRAALYSGLPALLWHPEASSEALRGIVTRLVEDAGLGDLPGRVQALRQADFQESVAPSEENIVRNLVVLWDDPRRLALLDHPPDQPHPGGDIADEQAS